MTIRPGRSFWLMMLAGMVLACGVSAVAAAPADQPPARALPRPEVGRPIAPVEDVPATGPWEEPVRPLRPQVGRPIAPVGPGLGGARGGEGQTADIIFVGTLSDVKEGPVAQSYPPIYSYTLTFAVKEVLRGNLDKSLPVSLGHRVAAENPPRFAQGSDHIVFAKSDARQGLRIVELKVSDESALKAARLAAALPVGWTADGDKVLSPWAAVASAAWPAGAKVPEGLAKCSKSGRPALLAGKGLVLEAKPVPPVKEVQFSNPDGDGEYTITITNTTDKPVDVPALLSDEGGVRWDQCLLIGCQGRFRPATAVQPLKGAPKPTRIEPGKSLSTTVNVFLLTGVDWPRGGYRIEFTFCLGELAASHAFYYMSRHHDPIRARVLKDAGITDTPASRPVARPMPANVPGLAGPNDP